MLTIVVTDSVFSEVHAQLSERVQMLRRQLKSESVEKRRDAVRDLIQLGPAAAPAASALLEWIDHPRLGWDVQEAFYAIGPSSLPLLAAGLREGDPARKVAVLQCISRFGRYGRRAQTEIVVALLSDDASVRLAALRALAELAPTDPELVPQLADLLEAEDAQQRAEAARTLGQMGRISWEAIPAITVALKDEVANVRASAAGPLATFGPQALPAMPTLIELLADSDSQVRRIAAVAIANTWEPYDPLEHPDDQPTAVYFAQGLPMLISAMKSTDQRVRGAAVQVCLGLPKPVVTANFMEVLIERLADSDQAVLIATLDVITKLSLDDPVLVHAVGLLTQHDDDLVRFVAYRTLEVIGAGMPNGPQIVLTGLRHTGASTQRAAIQAAIKLAPGNAEVIAELLSILENNDNVGPMLMSSTFVAQALAGMGKIVLEPVLERLNNSDFESSADLRLGAVETLGELGALARPALSTLLPMLDEENLTRYQRSVVLNSIVNIGLGDNEQYLNRVIQLLSDDDPYIREVGVRIIVTVDENLWPAVMPHIGARLDDSDDNVVMAALYGIMQFGGSAKSAVPQLVRMVEASAVDSGSLMALETLWRVQGPTEALVRRIADRLNSNYWRESAAQLLAQIGAPAAYAFDDIVAVLGMSDTRTDAFLAEALMHIFHERDERRAVRIESLPTAPGDPAPLRDPKQRALAAMQRALEVSDIASTITIVEAMYRLGAEPELLRTYVENVLPTGVPQPRVRDLLRLLTP